MPVTPVPVVARSEPAIWLAPVEVNVNPAAAPRLSEPPDSVASGPGPVEVSTAPVDTSTRAEPVRVNPVADASSSPPASVAAEPAPVSWNS